MLLVVGPSLQPVLLLVIQSIVLFSLLSSFSGEIIYVDVILLILPDFRIQVWLVFGFFPIYIKEFGTSPDFILPSVSQGQSITDIGKLAYDSLVLVFATLSQTK